MEWIGFYLSIGVLVFCLLLIFSKGRRTRTFEVAPNELRLKVAQSSQIYLPFQVAKVIIVLSAIVFFPVLIYGALTRRLSGKD